MAQLQFFFAMDEEKVNKYFSEIKEVADQRRCTIDEKPQKEDGNFKFTAYGTLEQLKELRAFLIMQGLPQGNLVE
jgi:hypothetical protein